jgi:hypothetical protein
VEAAVSLLQHAQAVHVHGHRHQLTKLEPEMANAMKLQLCLKRKF